MSVDARRRARLDRARADGYDGAVQRAASMGQLTLDVPVRIPAWVRDHRSFRRWACSDQFPEKGQVSYLAGEFWVDLSLERLVHNQIKSEFNRVLASLVKTYRLGLYLADRMLLTNLKARLSTEPDGMFLSDDARSSGRAKLKKGDDSLEVLGTPDMVLEVVSPSSVEKDTVVLRRLYFVAGVTEYWLVDSREADPRLEILRRSGTKYTAARRRDGWTKSDVFAKEFRLLRREAGDDVSDFTLEVR